MSMISGFQVAIVKDILPHLFDIFIKRAKNKENKKIYLYESC